MADSRATPSVFCTLMKVGIWKSKACICAVLTLFVLHALSPTHAGTRKKVGFAYDMLSDTAVDVANEMVDNLSLDCSEADYIASLIQVSFCTGSMLA